MQRKLRNPFVTIGDIPTEYFCDRQKETAYIMRTLINESNLVLMSPRRMGKSKLVQHVFKQAEINDNYYTFYIDLLHTTSLRELTFTFGKTVFDQLKTRSQKAALSLLQALRSLTGSFGFDSVTNLPTFTLEMGRIVQPEFTLQEIFDWLNQADKPCIVCFDEFQRITSYTDNREAQVEALLRGHIQHLSNVRFIFSGSERHLLDEMFYSKAKPFYNSANQLSLAAIDPEVYQEFATKWFEAYGKSIHTDAIRHYYETFEGTTFYLQKLMHEAFIDCQPGDVCDDALLATTLENMLEEQHETYMKLLGTLSERQKEALYAIAREGRASKIMSAAFLKKYALASSSIMQTAVKRLVESEIITQMNGEYYVSDILFKIFLQRLF